jgi:hypothetical protein
MIYQFGNAFFFAGIYGLSHLKIAGIYGSFHGGYILSMPTLVSVFQRYYLLSAPYSFFLLKWSGFIVQGAPN